MNDKITLAYAFDNTVRIYACKTTSLVEHARLTHGLWPTVTAALGRVLTMASMMSLMNKDESSITIRINGDGPIGNLCVEAKKGIVRGYVDNPEVFLQYNNGHLNVGGAVGKDGCLTIIKDLGLKEPFTSTTALYNGEIAEDFTYYYAISEQIPSSIGLGVLVNTDNSCLAAGGFIVQIMNGCSEETISFLENKIKGMKPVSKMIEEGYSSLDIIKEITDNNFNLLDEFTPKYECNCSKERFYRGIKSLGSKEILDIINTDKQAVCNCRFCHKEYIFNVDELKSML